MYLDFILGFAEISVDKEVAEENKVTAVHGKGEVDVGDTYVTAFSSVHHL